MAERGGERGGERDVELCPPVSVVVPTFNRRAGCLALLRSLEAQNLPASRFEVVVVDNNSSDGTAEAVERFAGESRLRLRCLVEPEQGAAYARNRGIRESESPFVAFTDDDVEVEPGWLEECACALESRSAAGVGGRTIPVWGAAFPSWWHADCARSFFKEWGDEPRAVTEFPFFYSHNLMLRRDVLERVGLFETRFGPKGRRHLVGEDADLCRRIHEAGGSLWYVPTAVVRHHVAAERMTRHFIRRRSYYGGMTHALHHAVQARMLHLPYQLKAMAQAVPEWGVAGSAADRFRAEMRFWYRLGFFVMGVKLAAGRGGGPGWTPLDAPRETRKPSPSEAPRE